MKNKTLKIAAVVLVAVMCAACLVACIPGKPESLQKKLEKKGYDVEVASSGLAISSAEIFLDATGIESIVTASKSDGADTIIAYYFDTAAHAKDAKKVLDDNMSKNDKEDMKESNSKYGVSGKCFYMATKNAAKDAGV